MRRLWRFSFGRTSLTLAICLAFLAGAGRARVGPDFDAVWIAGCFLALTGLAWRRRNVLTLLLAISLGLSLGWWRGSAYVRNLSNYQPLYGRTVTLTVRAADAAVYDTRKQLAFDADHASYDGTALTGKLQVGGFGENAVFRGDRVKVTGKLYPGFGSYQARIGFAALRVVKRSRSPLDDIRRRFAAGLQTALPEPLAPFAMGLLIGQRATLPAAVKQDLLAVGLTHIIAVSGYNLTIMLNVSRRLLAGQSKRLATLLSLGLIGGFLLLAGTSASIVRAAIVSTLSIFADYHGRTIRPLNLLALTALITVWANPAYLWGDLSWYLSFTAFFGVMILSPLFQARWPGRWHNSLIGGVALESLCAEIMSLPLILHVFGQMSLAGLPANLLVTSLIPLAMLLSLIAGLGGMLAGSVAGWSAWPASQLLNYMLDTAHLIAGLPHVFIQNLSLSLAAMLTLYVLVGGIALILNHKTKTANPAIVTDMKSPEIKSFAA